ncbi:F0F1 ATP synthase subunit B' [Phaeovulum sp. W22_SRMD_FR3]|uniref:F0F1 ATP synthase subunit B' n=1 Tax=Phaeovulum sp. W22_SRMD_FR3 TaxID=3240274 RepID=UPI003F950D60
MATETHEAVADMAHAAGHTAEKAGMPQLDFSTFPNQIFWLVITLVVIYWVLSRIALPRIGAVLADRQGTISGDLSAAEELKMKAKEAEAAYQAALVEARSEANKIVTAAKAEIKAELDASIAQADAGIAAKAAESEARINEIRAGALAAVEAVAKDTAAEIVAAFGGAVDPAAVSEAVSARLKG